MTAIPRLLVAVAVTTWPAFATACGTHGTNAGEIVWIPTSTDGTTTSGRLLLESTLVPPTESTTCVAGVGLGSDTVPTPTGLAVDAASIVVHNLTTGVSSPVTAFAFAPNSTTTSSMAAGSGSSTVANTNPLFPGSNWFGFSSVVLPFATPGTAPDEILAFEFEVSAPNASLPALVPAQFAAGEGQSDGTAIFTGEHPAQYFTASDPNILFNSPIPEPTTAVLCVVAVGGVWMFRLRARALHERRCNWLQ